MKIRVDETRVLEFVEYLRRNRTLQAIDWTFEGLPAVGDPGVPDYFFCAVKHQFGFWTDDGERYSGPMYGDVAGRKLKGSDFVWNSLTRSVRDDPGILDPVRQVAMTDEEIQKVFADDSGNCPLPLIEEHCRLWRGYAEDMIRNGETPSEILLRCSAAGDPISELMNFLRGVTGYREDPLAKKAALLTMILRNRPEQFLGMKGKTGEVPPIVDYHNMRSALRTGLIVVRDDGLCRMLEERRFVAREEEELIREAVFELVKTLADRSGQGLDAIDWLFFMNRRQCPEMSEPDCESCELNSVCAKEKGLFQPIHRTTYY